MADFFTSGINLRLPVAIAFMVALYILSYLLWAAIWLSVYWCASPGCEDLHPTLA